MTKGHRPINNKQTTNQTCSGHGGVRYWIYTTADGKRIELPTERHYEHPEALSQDELAHLSANNEHKNQSPTTIASNNATLVQIIMILMVCSTAAFVVKQMWS